LRDSARVGHDRPQCLGSRPVISQTARKTRPFGRTVPLLAWAAARIPTPPIVGAVSAISASPSTKCSERVAWSNRTTGWQGDSPFVPDQTCKSRSCFRTTSSMTECLAAPIPRAALPASCAAVHLRARLWRGMAALVEIVRGAGAVA
jgi:hypothetical protein